MLAGEKFGVFHAYIEEIMGRPVYTHELAIQSISDEIKEKSRDDFIKLCKEEQELCEDCISRQWLIECVNEGWIKFDTEKDRNIFIHLVRDIAPPVTPQPKMER